MKEKPAIKEIDPYLLQPFIAWDGEGCNNSKGQHEYFMLANSVGDGIYKKTKTSLDSAYMAGRLLQSAYENSNAIHVVYGANYDFNLMFRGTSALNMSKPILKLFNDGVWVKHNGFLWQFHSGRSLQIKSIGTTFDDYTYPMGQSIMLYDVLPFFQTSFVNALDEYLGTWKNSELVKRMKDSRSMFDTLPIENIEAYNDLELKLLVQLMEEFRNRLYDCGIKLYAWYGPGVIASEMFKENRIKNYMAKGKWENGELGHAVRASYMGGRFEAFKFGETNKPCFEYDINSAYPYALTKVPNLAGGKWEHIKGDPGDLPFALYHVKNFGRNYFMDKIKDKEFNAVEFGPAPLFHRWETDSITFPQKTIGWYWSPEISVFRKYMKQYERLEWEWEIDEAWVFHPANNVKPFAFVNELYRRRLLLKRAGSGAHVGYKLGLNSMYGKLAQQLGGEIHRPPYHQLEWAGYVTSHCRAQIMELCLESPDSIIAIETDAVFSTKELHCDIGDGLGQWEQTKFDNLMYVKSGTYFGDIAGKETTVRTRGITRGDLERKQIHEIWESQKYKTLERNMPLHAQTRRSEFVTLGQALQWGIAKWGMWKDTITNVSLEPGAGIEKRAHDRLMCNAHTFPGLEWHPMEWHTTRCIENVNTTMPIENAEHNLSWITGDNNTVRIQSMLGAGEQLILPGL
ncbi:MAG: DNA polymerase [Candidatus Saccharimonadales bacterium]